MNYTQIARRGPSGVGVVGNPVCGDLMQIQIKVEDGILTDVKLRRSAAERP